MARRLSGAIRPTLPKAPKLPKRTNIAAKRANIAPKPPSVLKPKRHVVPKTMAAKPKSKIANVTAGVNQAMDIHSHIADAVINSHNLITPGAVLAAHAIQKSTGLNNLSAFSSGSGIHHKVKH